MSKSSTNRKAPLAFSRKNYILMFVGLGVLVLGFFVMTLDKEDYGFGFLGLTLGPILVFVGFIIQFFAILHKSDKTK